MNKWVILKGASMMKSSFLMSGRLYFELAAAAKSSLTLKSMGGKF
jgi:hypothetical protein